MKFNKNWNTGEFYSLLAYVAIALFCVIGIATVDNYGMGFDEQSYGRITNMNLRYAQHFSESEIKAPDEVVVYYGPSFHIVKRVAALFIYETFEWNFVDAQHVVLVLAGTALLLFFFLLVRAMFTPAIGFYSVLLLSLYPHFIAHSHYNPKDLPQAALIMAAMYFLYKTFVTRRYLFAFLAAVAYGIALSTTVSVLVVAPIFVFSYALYLFFEVEIHKKKQWKAYCIDELKRIAVFAVGTAATAYFTWPLLWHDASIFFGAIELFSEHTWKGSVLYFGEIYKAKELPWHYTSMHIIMATPLITLFLIGAGIFFAGKRLRKKEWIFSLGTIAAWFGLPLLVFTIPGSVNYDGFRHILMSIPALIVFGGIALDTVLIKTPKYGKYAVVFVFIAWSLVEIVAIHPYQGSYVNEAVRLAVPQNLEKHIEVEYWGVTYREGAQWLEDNAQENTVVCVPNAGHLAKPFIERDDITFSCQKDAYTHLMYMTRGGALQRLTHVVDSLHQEPIYTISRQGADYLYIYQLSE